MAFSRVRNSASGVNFQARARAASTSKPAMIFPHAGRRLLRLEAMPSYPVPLDELPGDDDALHFVGALADAEQRRVAVKALDHEFLRVAVAAVDAHRLVRVLEGGLGGEVLGHAGLEVAALAPVVDLGRLPYQQARCLDARRHLAELELDRLVLADRLAEGLALLRVPQRLGERRLRDADAACRDVDAPELEPAGRLLEAAAFLADEVTRGDAVVLEDELGRVDALVAELLELAACLESRPLLAEEHRHAAVPGLGVGVGLRQDREARPLDAVRDPGLGALQDIRGALPPCPHADGLKVRTGVGLREGESAADFPAGELR